MQFLGIDLTKDMQNSTELVREIKDLNKWREFLD